MREEVDLVNSQVDRQSCGVRQTGSQSDRQAGADRQTDRQTDR